MARVRKNRNSRHGTERDGVGSSDRQRTEVGLPRSAGGVGEPPEDLTLAFAMHLSAHSTQALISDFDQTPAKIGALTADILRTLLRRAVQAQHSAGADVSTGADGDESRSN